MARSSYLTQPDPRPIAERAVRHLSQPKTSEQVVIYHNAMQGAPWQYDSPEALHAASSTWLAVSYSLFLFLTLAMGLA